VIGKEGKGQENWNDGIEKPECWNIGSKNTALKLIEFS